MLPNVQFTVDLVTFTDKIHNGNFHLLCTVATKASSEPCQISDEG